jgi:hypothetical protein
MKKNKALSVDQIEENLAALEYKPGEDIYNKSKKQQDINPDDNTVIRDSKEKGATVNEKGFEDDLTGDDLDIPGAELDDSNEKIGEEDEENNYFSLGGDNHDDLEESKD